MKSFVNTLAAAVRRAPWAVILVTVVVGLVLGSLGGQFKPADDMNEGFAPDAEELLAAERISEQYGGDTFQSVMQIIVSSDAGDVITADGIETSAAVREAITSGPLADYLATSPEQPSVVSFMGPVEQAIAFGAPAPSSDPDVKQLYEMAYAQTPPEQRGFIDGMLPTDADRESLTSPSGLMLSFAIGSFEDPDFVEASIETAEAIAALSLPEGYAAEAFSMELIFSGESEFQSEIGRLFATAGFIILLVLMTVFLVLPKKPRNKIIAGVGIAAMLGAITMLVVPGLAKVYPDLFPAGVADWQTSTLLPAAAGVFLLVFVVWSVSTGRLRRTVADTLITMAGIGFAVSIMNGFGYLIYGQAGQMSQILPILLIGLGVDYSIHITSRYREETSEGEPVADAVATSIRTVGVALVLATITTAVGFLTNVLNEIPALREFGVLAAIGIVASFIIMLTFVPAVRLLLDRRGERRETLDRESLRGGDARLMPSLVGKTSWLAKHAAIPTVIVVVVLGTLGAFGARETLSNPSFSFIDFVPVTSPYRATFETLIDDYGGGLGEKTQVLVEGDVATPEAYNAMVAATLNMTGVDDVVQFGPLPAADSPVGLVIQLANPDSPSFNPAVAQVAGAAGMSRTSMAVSDSADVGALYAALFAADPQGAADVLYVDESSGYASALFTIQTQAGEKGAGGLRAGLDEAFAPVTEAGFSATPTSTEIISDVIIGTLRDSQVSSLLYTLVTVLILLVLNFWFEVRRPLLGVITWLPVVLVVVLSFAIMWVAGIPFGPITATVAALAVGIGIPYMIHVTHRYEEDRIRYDNENEAIESTLTHTGGALGGSAMTTIFGFGILITSSTIPFRQFGFVTAYTILLSLLGAILVLPSMLVVWDRWHRRRGDVTIEADRVEAALGETRSS
ncbi:MAG: MMPL family transporter [Actinomycetota bacterium]